MHTTRVFTNGNSQAVRLPREFRFEGGEVVIKKVGDMVILFPKEYKSARFKELLAAFDSDFQIERTQPNAAQARDFSAA
jgi:antitoxin VapB